LAWAVSLPSAASAARSPELRRGPISLTSRTLPVAQEGRPVGFLVSLVDRAGRPASYHGTRLEFTVVLRPFDRKKYRKIMLLYFYAMTKFAGL
jgi:hypothetical protein